MLSRYKVCHLNLACCNANICQLALNTRQHKVQPIFIFSIWTMWHFFHSFEGKVFKSHFNRLHLDPRDPQCQDMDTPLRNMTLGLRFGLYWPYWPLLYHFAYVEKLSHKRKKKMQGMIFHPFTRILKSAQCASYPTFKNSAELYYVYNYSTEPLRLSLHENQEAFISFSFFFQSW